MESFDLYKDIATRTGGDIYIGVVGPVRSGKSTFIKKFMDLMVLPNIENEHVRQRATDELPQSAAGKTIMTTQPKFIPNEAVSITVDGEAKCRVRMVDCVGYMVEGAMGFTEFEAPRMVTTPWFEGEIPFIQAAEIGTKKVIDEHSTIGIIVTTDGSITDIPRAAYVNAEEKVVGELDNLGKPYVIVINSANPNSQEARSLKEKLCEKYKAPVMLMDILSVGKDEINEILRQILFEFPITQVNFALPGWANALSPKHRIIKELTEKISDNMQEMYTVKDGEIFKNAFCELDYIKSSDCNIDLAKGVVNYDIKMKESLFYSILGEECGYDIKDDRHLMRTVKELVAAKKEYDKYESAIKNAEEFGYGVVTPCMEELTLEEPEIVKQGNKFGVKLKAGAPSMHLVRVNIKTEVSPIVGTERQSQEMVEYLLSEFENDPSQIWSTDIFGKPLHELVKEGLSNKLNNIPEDAREKMQETLERVVNEGDGGMLCILL